MGAIHNPADWRVTPWKWYHFGWRLDMLFGTTNWRWLRIHVLWFNNRIAGKFPLQ